MIDANIALRRLREGNDRFTAGKRTRSTATTAEDRRALVAGQSPFAAVIGCADSRVPVELIFDQGPGDIFVIRVAGNIITSAQTGSVEFAAAILGVRLVVVLGHTQCGAVQAALAAANRPPEERENEGPAAIHLQAIVEHIHPGIAHLRAEEGGPDPESLLEQAVRANVHDAVDRLREHSPLLQSLIAAGDLSVVGALYSLESGQVDFFSGG